MNQTIERKRKSLRGLFPDYITASTRMIGNPLKMLDGNKVSSLDKSQLKHLLEKQCFSEEEKSYIKELRRKYQCRQTSLKHREAEKVQEIATVIEIEGLEIVRNSLLSEKNYLVKDIHLYLVELRNGAQ